MWQKLRFLVQWFGSKSVQARRAKTLRRQEKRCRLGIEVLEDRLTPSAGGPVAYDDAYAASQGQTLVVGADNGVLTNDTGDNPLTAVLVSGPSHAASFTLNSDGSFSDLPALGFIGDDTFQYEAFDGSDYSNTATVTISIGQGTPNITWSNPASIVYGTPLSDTQLNAGAGVDGTFSYSPAAGTVLSAGTMITLHTTFTPTDTTDYATISSEVHITVTPAALTVSSGVSADGKTYDDGSAATLSFSTPTLSGIVGSDDVSLDTTSDYAAAFDTAAAGTAKTVTVSGLALTGAQASNYTLTQPTLSANITPATLTISNISGTSKTYDGTTADTITGTPSLAGVIGADDVTLDSSDATATFTDMNAGTNKTVIYSGFTLDGADAANYSLVQGSGSADITPIALTVAANPQSVVYGSTVPTLTYQLTSGAFLGSDGFSGALTSGVGNAGAVLDHDDGIDVGCFGITQGTLSASSNYAITFQTGDLLVTPKALTISSGVSGNSKTYDGATTATLSFSSPSLTGIVGSDDVSVDTSSNYSAAFNSPVVGTAKPVTVSGLGLTGAEDVDYTLTQPSLAANVSQATLTLSGITGTDKTYDGTTGDAITGTPTLVGIIGSDVVTLNSSAAAANFTDQNAGSGKTVLFSGFTLGGADAGNYTLDPGSSSADIAPIALTVTADPQSAVYGSAVPTLSYELTSGAFLGDDGFSGALTSAAGNAGATLSHDNGIDVGSYAITQGTLSAGSNYAITFVGDSLAVTAKTLTISSGVSADSKTYDGSTAATLSFSSPSLLGVVGSDLVSVDTSSDLTAAFDTADAGTGKTVTVSGLGLTGAQAGDYTLTQPSLSADISKADATITVTPYTVGYDGNSHTATGTATGVNGETLSGLDLSGTTHTSVGIYSGDGWTFSNPNYNSASGSIDDGIINVTLTNPGDQSNFDGDYVAIDLSATDSAGYVLNYSVASNTPLPNGLSIDPNSGIISGTTVPQADTSSPYSITVIATDAGNISASQSFTWTVSPVTLSLANPGNQTNNDGYFAALDLAWSNSANHSVTFSATGLPAGLSIDTATGTIYGPIADDADTNGPYSVTVTVADSAAGASAEQSFVWNVESSTPSVWSNEIALNVVRNTPSEVIDLSQYTSAAGSDLPRFTIVSQPANGTLAPIGPTTFEYISNPNYTGSDSFTFEATDGALTSSTATFSLNVTETAPTASNTGTYYLLVGQSITISDLATYGFSPSTTGLTPSIVSGPTYGTLTSIGAGQYQYTAPSYVTSDSFTFTLSDGIASSGTATATIQVLDAAMTANNVNMPIAGDVPVVITAAQILNNAESVLASPSFSVVSVGSPGAGTIASGCDGKWIFTPPPSCPNDPFTGTTLPVTITDGVNTARLTLTLFVPVPPNRDAQEFAEQFGGVTVIFPRNLNRGAYLGMDANQQLNINYLLATSIRPGNGVSQIIAAALVSSLNQRGAESLLGGFITDDGEGGYNVVFQNPAGGGNFNTVTVNVSRPTLQNIMVYGGAASRDMRPSLWFTLIVQAYTDQYLDGQNAAANSTQQAVIEHMFGTTARSWNPGDLQAAVLIRRLADTPVTAVASTYTTFTAGQQATTASNDGIFSASTYAIVRYNGGMIDLRDARTGVLRSISVADFQLLFQTYTTTSALD